MHLLVYDRPDSQARQQISPFDSDVKMKDEDLDILRDISDIVDHSTGEISKMSTEIDRGRRITFD